MPKQVQLKSKSEHRNKQNSVKNTQKKNKPSTVKSTSRIIKSINQNSVTLNRTSKDIEMDNDVSNTDKNNSNEERVENITNHISNHKSMSLQPEQQYYNKIESKYLTLRNNSKSNNISNSVIENHVHIDENRICDENNMKKLHKAIENESSEVKMETVTVRRGFLKSRTNSLKETSSNNSVFESSYANNPITSRRPSSSIIEQHKHSASSSSSFMNTSESGLDIFVIEPGLSIPTVEKPNQLNTSTHLEESKEASENKGTLLRVPEVKSWRRSSESAPRTGLQKKFNVLYHSSIDLTTLESSRQPADTSSRGLSQARPFLSTLPRAYHHRGSLSNLTTTISNQPENDSNNISKRNSKLVQFDTAKRDASLSRLQRATRLSQSPETKAQAGHQKVALEVKRVQTKPRPPLKSKASDKTTFSRVDQTGQQKQSQMINKDTAAISKSASQPALQHISSRQKTSARNKDNRRTVLDHRNNNDIDIEDESDEESRVRKDRVVNWLDELDRYSVEPPPTPNIEEEKPSQTDTAIHIIYESD